MSPEMPHFCMHQRHLLECVFAVDPNVKIWGVARTKSRCEKSFAEYLRIKNVPVFLPLVANRRVYGRHIRVSHNPLFSGYVFFDGNALSRAEVFASRRIAEILIPPDQGELKHDLEQVAFALQKDNSLRENKFGEVGRPVFVKSGPLKGLSGEFVRLGNDGKLVIKVSFIRKAVEMGIDEAFVEPIL